MYLKYFPQEKKDKVKLIFLKAQAKKIKGD